MKDVEFIIGTGNTAITRWIRAGEFPKPTKRIVNHTSKWLFRERDINEWIRKLWRAR
jgi:predicted DNA-binding transcriptional regulator AlpA